MRGGAFLKGKEGRVGFRKNTFFNGKEGRDDFRNKQIPDKEALYFLPSKLHLSTQHGSEYHFDILPEGVMAVVIAV